VVATPERGGRATSVGRIGAPRDGSHDPDRWGRCGV